MPHDLRPTSPSGNGGAGGMVSSPIQPLSSSDREGSSSRYQRITSAVSARSYSTGPPMITPFSPMSWQRNVNEVTTPKVTPPPRNAQNKSPCESSLAVTNVPSASTTSAARRLSTVSPKRRDREPMPPPSVRHRTP